MTGIHSHSNKARITISNSFPALSHMEYHKSSTQCTSSCPTIPPLFWCCHHVLFMVVSNLVLCFLVIYLPIYLPTVPTYLPTYRPYLPSNTRD